MVCQVMGCLTLNLEEQICDQGFLPLAFDRSMFSWKAADATLVYSGYFIFPVPTISVSIPLSASWGGARWKSTNLYRLTYFMMVRGYQCHTLTENFPRWVLKKHCSHKNPQLRIKHGLSTMLAVMQLILHRWVLLVRNKRTIRREHNMRDSEVLFYFILFYFFFALSIIECGGCNVKGKYEGTVRSSSLVYNQHGTQDKQSLGRDPHRNWCHLHTSVKLS